MRTSPHRNLPRSLSSSNVEAPSVDGFIAPRSGTTKPSYSSDAFVPPVIRPGAGGETPPPPVDFSTLKPSTVSTIEGLEGYEPGQLQVMCSSSAVNTETRTKLAMMIGELESSGTVPPEFVQQVVSDGKDFSEIVAKLGVSDATLASLGQHLQTTPDQLAASWASKDETGKADVLQALFKLTNPPPTPITVIEELANNGATLASIQQTLGVSAQTLSVIGKLEGLPQDGTTTAQNRWETFEPGKKLQIITKLFQHENLIPAYDDEAGQQKRVAQLKKLIEAQDKPGFASNLGDFAIASLVNILSDYVVFSALRYKNPAEHGGQPVSIAYRVYQAALQSYSALWLGANHGTGTALAFAWNQWNGTNDFGYYGLGTIADKLGIKPASWDGADWTKAVFNDQSPPTWFSWTYWAVTHPGQPTTGSNILTGALNSTPTTLSLLASDKLNDPWRGHKGNDFTSEVGRFLSKIVPGPVFR